MARPVKYTDEIALQIVEALEAGNSIANACSLAGIVESTYHLWVERGDDGEEPFSEFSELTRRARARGQQKRVKAITTAEDDDWRAAAWFLERSDPANWGRRDAVDVTSKGKQIQTQVRVYDIPNNGRDDEPSDTGTEAG